MADEEKRITYVIRVISESGEGEGEKGEASSKSDVAGGDKKKKKKTFGEMNLYEKGKFISKLAPVGYAVKMANNVITNEINRVELRTGNAVLARKVEYTQSVITRSAATAGALAIGIGTMNPIIIAGAVASAADQALDVHQRQISLNLERQLESVGIGMANIRAGAYGSRGGRSDI